MAEDGNKQDRQAQQKMMQARAMQQQAQQLEGQLQAIQTALSEVMQGLESVKALKNEKELLFPLGGGAFVKAGKSDDKILYDVGAQIIAEKDYDSVISSMEERRMELENALKNAGANLNALVKRAQQEQFQ
ncbi:prefoldin subunit alpha [Candidatus Micrarchaeota archaeon]|nr:prefoldin subunit alpha [Candidatus Micrarchaeota archaeon]